MATGTNGRHGLLALPLARMERCRELAIVTAPRTEVQSAEENGKKPPTASSEIAQVQYSSLMFANASSESVCMKDTQVSCRPLVDGRWLLWSSWGSCSKSCGGGNQLRQRVCEGPFFGGEPCNGEKTELRNCNEKRCPGESSNQMFYFIYAPTLRQLPEVLINMRLTEPHEICGEENYGSVVWKKTPAGDTAAVACPSDATGTIRDLACPAL